MAKLRKNSASKSLFQTKTPQQQATDKTLTIYGITLILFGFLCWFMQVYFGSGYQPSYADVPLKGGAYGPIEVSQPNTNYQLKLSQYSIAVDVWNAVDIEVLDDNKNYLFGFGDELWHEKGYDDGHWDETKRSVKMDIHFDKAGQYYLSISAQSNATLTNESGYSLMISQQRGSIIPFQWLKYITFILGTLILLYRYREKLSEMQS
jgi:hypothetical protein